MENRTKEHNNGRNGTKYTRGRHPVRVVYIERCSTLSDALKKEARIKKLSQAQKMCLIENCIASE